MLVGLHEISMLQGTLPAETSVAAAATPLPTKGPTNYDWLAAAAEPEDDLSMPRGRAARTRSDAAVTAPLRTAGWGATLLACAVILCAVALINGGPVIYPDSGLYISDGERVMRLTAPLAVRPVFYGLAVWLLDRAGTVWPVLFVKAS